MPTIRTATPTDASAIATIHVRSWQHAYRELLPADKLAALSIEDRSQVFEQRLSDPDPMHYLVAEENDTVIGFAGWGPTNPPESAVRMLYSIYLAPDSMGKGTGSSLLVEVERGMIADGAETGTLHVLKDNQPTRRFYERHGWILVPDSDEDEHFFGITVHTVAYAKVLA